jgi:hypothetical protein
MCNYQIPHRDKKVNTTMFNNTLRGISSAFAMAALIISSLTIGATSASADDTFVAPEPTAQNACGTQNDWIDVPDSFGHPEHGFSGYTIDGVPVTGTRFMVSEPRSVTVVAAYDSGSWTYVFDDAPCVEEATNLFTFERGECDSDTASVTYGYTSATVSITNVADGTGLPLEPIKIRAERSDGWSLGASIVSDQIQDGEKVTIPLVAASDGLLPGEYVITFFRDDPYKVLARLRPPPVPDCGDFTAPEESMSGKTKGSIKRIAYKRAVKVTLNNRNVDHREVARLKINPPKGEGKTKFRAIRVSKYDTKMKRYYRQALHTRYTLTVKVDGKRRVLDRFRLRPARS